MNSGVIQLLVLAGVAIFLILKLKNVLGTRDGFEKPALHEDARTRPVERRGPDLSVVEGGLDRDIIDHVKAGSPAADALARMKSVEPAFSLGEFLQGAKGAYEMILMAFQRGNIEPVRAFLAADVAASFDAAIAERKSKGLTVEAQFSGLRELAVAGAEFDKTKREAEISLRFLGEITTVVRDAAGKVVDGNRDEIQRQQDTWTFARKMGTDNPNWTLVATSE
jgi:predicted lipid-binding transport protein (Tim44 family)